jgi:hypothetical protein
MTDSIEEYEALRKLIRDTDLCMIQWRNFNIDPDWYLGKIGVTDTGECMGVKQLMELIRKNSRTLSTDILILQSKGSKEISKKILRINICRTFAGKDYGTRTLPSLKILFAYTNSCRALFQ